METIILSVEIVSDGIVVKFGDGVLTYFPGGFLRQHIGVGSNQVLVEHDSCPASRTLGSSPKSPRESPVESPMESPAKSPLKSKLNRVQ